jgi:hypothetical protein
MACARSCRVCGAPARAACVRCKDAWYCGALHQRLDWRAEHKGECAPCGAPARRAIFVTMAVDVHRVSRAVAATFAAAGYRFVVPLFYLAKNAATGVDELRLLLTHCHADHDVACVASDVGIALEKLSENGLEARDIFTFTPDDAAPRDAKGRARVGLAIGLEAACRASLEYFKDALHDAAHLRSTDAVLRAVLEGYARAGSPGFAFGTAAHRPTKAHAAEAALHDPTFLARVENTAPPYPAALPLGARTTVFDFSHGLFYRRVDLAACHRGLLPERVLGIAPTGKPTVHDCRLARARADRRDAEPE